MRAFRHSDPRSRRRSAGTKSVSLSDAQQDLGRLADEVNETGRSVVLTRRGRPIAQIAQIVPRTATRFGKRPDGDLRSLKGTVRLNCTFTELQRAISDLRGEYVRSAGRRHPLICDRLPRGS